MNRFLLFVVPILVLGIFGLVALAAEYPYDEMDAVAITKTTVVGPYPGVVSANELDVSWATATIGSGTEAGNSFTSTGKELLLVWNKSGSLIPSVSFYSQYDSSRRKSDVANYSINPNTISQFYFGSTAGWKNATGTIYIQSSTDVDLEWAVLTLP